MNAMGTPENNTNQKALAKLGVNSDKSGVRKFDLEML